MIDAPHIRGFSPAALCITLTSALASARLVGSVRPSINAATLSLVGLVLLSAISPSSVLLQFSASGGIVSKDKVSRFGLLVAGEAAFHKRRRARFAICEVTEPPATGCGVLFGVF